MGSQSRFPRYACPVQKLKLLFLFHYTKPTNFHPNAYSWFHRYHGHATNACWTLQNLLPYLLEEGENHFAGFFCRQSEPENIQGPVTGQGKTNKRLCSNRSYKDDCRKIPGLYSNNSSGTFRSKPWKERCYTNCSKQNRAEAPDAMEHRSFLAKGSCSTKQIITTLKRSHSPGKNSCSDLNPRLFLFYAVLRQARLSRERLQDYKPWSKKLLPPQPFYSSRSRGSSFSSSISLTRRSSGGGWGLGLFCQMIQRKFNTECCWRSTQYWWCSIF